MPGDTPTLDAAVDHVQDQTIDAPVIEPVSTPEIDADDLDARELAEAQQALQAEQAGTVAPNATNEAPAPSEVNGQQPTAPTDKGPVPMIPKPRLDEVIAERERANEQVAYLRGQLEATQRLVPQAPAAPAAPEPPPKPTPAQVLARVDELKLATAEQFDAGEITAKEMAEKNIRLDRAAAAAREELILARLPKQEPVNPNSGDDLYLLTATVALEKDHPWLYAFPDDPNKPEIKSPEWKFMEDRARADLVAAGLHDDGTALYNYRFRERIAVLSDTYGPRFFPDFKPGTTPAPAAQGAPSATATARAAKLDLAANMPPDLNALAGAGNGTGALTDTQIEGMDDDEILANLPAATRNKMLGITAA